VKITINGEAFDYDAGSRPLSEALAIERAWGRRYAEWEEELQAGSAEAWAVFAWLIWRRDGRDVPLADILEGRVDFDYNELMRSVAAPADEEPEENPTSGAGPRTAPDGTDTTPSTTSGRSPKSSTSARGKSGSSPSASSTP
jgi:hypothetical protein